MIKAVSRQILEVSDTGNTYFEKAWLMVSPEFMNVGANKLEDEAESYLSELDAPSSMKKHRRLVEKTLSFLAAALSGGLVTAAALQLYGLPA